MNRSTFLGRINNLAEIGGEYFRLNFKIAKTKTLLSFAFIFQAKHGKVLNLELNFYGCYCRHRRTH